LKRKEKLQIKDKLSSKEMRENQIITICKYPKLNDQVKLTQKHFEVSLQKGGGDNSTWPLEF